MSTALSAYQLWRAKLSTPDRLRWDYLLRDAEPLLVDVIKQQVDGALTGALGSVERAVVDGVVDGAGRGVLAALLA